MIGDRILEAAGPRPWMWTASAALVGFGVAMLVYRFGVLPIAVPGLGGILIGVSVFALSLASGIRIRIAQFHRVPQARALRGGQTAAPSTTPDAAAGGTPVRVRPPLAVIGAAGVVGAAAAIGLGFMLVKPLRWMALTRWSLSHVQIELPATDPVRPYSIDSAPEGAIDFADAGHLRVAVRVWWRSDEHANLDDVLAGYSERTGAVPSNVRRTQEDKPAAVGGETVAFEARGTSIRVTRFYCGGRMYFISSGFEDGDVRPLHDRIVASILCTAH